MIRYRDVHGEPHDRPPDAPVEWRVSGYAIIERAGTLLMVEPAMDAGWTWGLPGGGIEREPEETLLDGIAREVYEETGYQFTPEPATLVFAGEVFYRTVRHRHLRSLLFAARGGIGSEPDPAWERPKAEVARVAWVEIESLRREQVQWHHWGMLERLRIVTSP
jgi:ADP-ribose pyrophosphatase YjhB (NUDIX family)